MQLPLQLSRAVSAIQHRATDLRAPAVLWAFLLMFAASGAFHARTSDAAQGDAIALVEQTVETLFGAIRAEREAITADASRVQPLVREIVLPQVDLGRVSRLVLGKHWRTATQPQKEEFQKEFSALVVRTYSDALVRAVDAEVEIIDGATSEDGTQTIVRSRVRRGNASSIGLAYRLEQGSDGEWRVIDIAIEGVSLVTTWRSEFSSMISRHGISGLIAHMSKRNSGTAS